MDSGGQAPASHQFQMWMDMTKKLSLDLKDKIDRLEAENYKCRQLLKQKIEEQQKEREQMRQLMNQIEALQKMKNTIETLSTQLAQKENSHKKMERENQRLFQVINHVADILSSADLLTEEVRRILQNLHQNSSSCEGELNSKDQEETDNSSPPPFQFCKNKTSSFQKEHVAPSSSTPKKNQFCHQQSEGCKKNTINNKLNTSNLNIEDSENEVTSSDSPNGVNLNFKGFVPSPFQIDFDKHQITFNFKSHQNSGPKNSSILPSETCLTNKQKDNVSSQPVDEGPCKKKPKVLY